MFLPDTYKVVYDLGRCLCLWLHSSESMQLLSLFPFYSQNIKARKVWISTVQLSFLWLKWNICGESQRDDWVSKVTCHWAWRPEYKSQEGASQLLHPVTFTYTLWYICTPHNTKTSQCKVCASLKLRWDTKWLILVSIFSQWCCLSLWFQYSSPYTNT